MVAHSRAHSDGSSEFRPPASRLALLDPQVARERLTKRESRLFGGAALTLPHGRF